MAVSKRLRYEVLRRDNHACRYCGSAAPDVKLTVDHVVPVALGGSDDASNLVAACSSCNGGKSATAPDAALIDDVSERDLQWVRACAIAAQEQRDEHDAGERLLRDFVIAWDREIRSPARLPDDWEGTILGLNRQGLTSEDLLYAIRRTDRKHLSRWDQWRYFNGTCQGILRDRRNRATKIVEDGIN